ncbi:3-dehydroquinate synthase [Candidatus Micrarchaeota archaeon]|nr:3-dehydroquinate synthase [Candidatus Micrarchaeota archaeon]
MKSTMTHASGLLLDLGQYPVLLGRGTLKACGTHAPICSRAFIIHQAASKKYAQTVAESLDERKTDLALVEVPDGEKAKELDQVEVLYEKALDAKLERTDAVFAVGGGCVGDAAGFFAATYLRGLQLVHVPTTLLAQVDSSIGGKVGVNLGATKNMVGSFYQPELVVDDIDALQSLPPMQISNGLAEVIKYGLIRDSDFLRYLEKNMDAVQAKDPGALLHVVQQSVQHKGTVVAQDEREAGSRMTLNYGHTLGHGIETVCGLPHGFAIAIGMHAAGILAVEKGLLEKQDLERQNDLIQAAGLALVAKTKADAEGIMEKVRNDKKRTAGKLRMVLLDKIGNCRIVEVTEKDAQFALEQVLE